MDSFHHAQYLSIQQQSNQHFILILITLILNQIQEEQPRFHANGVDDAGSLILFSFQLED